jgi:hypothetical protein
MLRIAIETFLKEWPELAEDIQLRADMLDAETPMSEALADLIRLSEGARALKEGTKDQLARLKARGERLERRIDFARTLMLSILQSADLKKVELPEATVYLRNNPPQVLGVGVVDADKLPDDLVKIERKPDRTKIKEALEAGRSLDGLVLSNSPPSIVVMVK